MEKTKRAQDKLVLSIIGVSAGIAFLGGTAYGESFKARKIGDNVKYVENEEIVSAGYGNNSGTLGFDEYNIIYDENEYSYTFIFDNYAGLNDSYFEVRYGDDRSSINLVRNYIADNHTEGHLIEFDQNVVDSFVAGFGDNNDEDAIFFILEDGSIEYILVGRAVKNDDYRTFKIDELTNVVKHYNANACSDVTSVCKRTVLVQSMDGTIYDLEKYVK